MVAELEQTLMNRMKREDSKQETEIRSSRYQQAVADVGALALTTSDMEIVVNEVVIAVITTLNVDRCQVLEVLPDGESLLLRAGAGWQPGAVGNLVVKASKDTQAGYTVRYQRTTVVEDFKTETRFRPTFAERDCHAASSVVVLVHNSHPFGVLGVLSDTVRRFTLEEIGFLESMANILSELVERQQLEEALRLSEDKYRTLFEECMDVVFFSTAAGELIDINPAGVRLFEYDSREEMLEINIAQDLFFDPADRKIYHQVLKQNNAVKDFELKLKTKAGKIVCVQETTTAVMDSKGNILAYRGIMRDITALRQAQEELQSLFMEIGKYCEQIRPEVHPVHRLRNFLAGLEEVARKGIQLTRRLLSHVYIDAEPSSLATDAHA